MMAFSIISVSIMLVLGVVVYIRFSASLRQEIVQSTQKLMEQTVENLEDYLVSMRRISDAVYYNVIKENDLSEKDN
ncbi:MAG: sensor histidine kinase, partial [Lachnospiraceae bacterium]|nr:sensor histidine kinase [Lachnospiraceae bacterium]